MNPRDIIRRCTFRPYRAGMGPSFTLVMRDTGRIDNRGSVVVAYRLTMRENGRTVVLFDGADYSGSPCVACDSDENVKGLLWFLTLRPGDTDEEYFTAYTEAQRAYCGAHAEWLDCAVHDRFGWDD